MRRSFFSRTGLCEKETEADRDVFYWVFFLAALEQTEPYHDGAPDAKKPTRTALHFRDPGARQGHMCYLTHGLEGLDIDLHVLYENKVLMRDRDVVGVQMHRLGIRECRGSCTPPMLFSPTLPSCASSRSRRCLQRPASHVQGVVSLYRQKKKKVLVHGLMQRAPRLVGSSASMVVPWANLDNTWLTRDHFGV